MSALSRELDFQLYECLETDSLPGRDRYSGQSVEDYASILSAAERLAGDFFAPHYGKGDANEPQFVDGAARTIAETGEAWRAFAEAGFLSAHWDAEEGGIQLPEPVFRAAMAHFFTANVATTGYPFLSIGAANLLRTFGDDDLKRIYLPAMASGESAGTMALTEPGQGSALGDIKTVAEPDADGSYRITGHKMFISGGDQDFTGNIVHMVLARIKGAPAGVKGISLFLVPKFILQADGSVGERNDVALAGLLHKMGWRNTTSTVLSFGEKGGAVGWLLGEPNRGLAHMFQLMNEARIGVGLIAACLAYRGFTESLAYARERPQGRLPSCRDPLSPQVRIIEHADVKRLLLTQKVYAEGALALCLQASAWFEDQHSHPDPGRREVAGHLLDLLTPVVKSWPSRYGCRSNDMAIQVLGGSGYTREYPVEQLYRDQRLNPIHEGTEAIHGLDLLGRKVRLADGLGLRTFLAIVRQEAEGANAKLQGYAQALLRGVDGLETATAKLVAAQSSQPDLTLAHATEYLDAFGRVTLAWIWLKQARVAQKALDAGTQADASHYYFGKLQAARHYFETELPLVHVQFESLAALADTTLEMRDEFFL
jgi:alkylation response protein AidB-like acyl-CoA dehydrogenase